MGERTRLRLYGTVCGLLLCALIGQAAGGADRDPFERGVEAYRQGQYEEARRILTEIVANDPGLVRPSLGSAAFWLGKAHRECGHPDSTAAVWARGVAALREEDRFDARLFDAYLQSTLRESPFDLERVSDVYLTLLRELEPRKNAERAILRRHVAQTLPLLDGAQRAHVLEGKGRRADESWTVRPNGGRWLATWWAHRDPDPTTIPNERLAEHFRRVGHAQAAYAYPKRPAQWDDRGDLYVRYGQPQTTHRIPFDDLQFIRKLQRVGVGVSRGDFPNNVIWAYPGVGEEGRYLFVERNGRFRLSSAVDLVPRKLSGHFGGSERSRARAYSSLAAMEYIYQHLSMHYQDRGNVYAQVASYLDELEGLRRIEALGGGGGWTTSRIDPPSTAANDAFRQSERQERTFVEQRRTQMPLEHVNDSTSKERLAVSVRTARFLDADGTTRTNVYWGRSPSASLETEGPKRILRVSATRYDADYRRVGQRTEQYTTGRDERHAGTWPGPAQTVLSGAQGPYHLALRWDVYGRQADKTRGEQRGQRVVRVDSLRSLRADPSRLEVSDLQLMALPGTSNDEPRKGPSVIEEAVPYPYPRANPRTPLLLYFEVYHLQKQGPQGQTRYTITYEIEREEEKGFFGRLFGGGDDEITSTSIERSGRQARTQEYIMLDLESLGDEDDGTKQTRIVVRVADQATGEQVERSVALTLTPQDEPLPH